MNLSWRKLGTVHDAIFNFEKQFGRKLLSLRLIGHELDKVGWSQCYHSMGAYQSEARAGQAAARTR